MKLLYSEMKLRKLRQVEMELLTKIPSQLELSNWFGYIRSQIKLYIHSIPHAI